MLKTQAQIIGPIKISMGQYGPKPVYWSVSPNRDFRVSKAEIEHHSREHKEQKRRRVAYAHIMKFLDCYVKIAIGSALIGASMELFMIKTGFYDKVTVLESEKQAWESSLEALAIREALNPWRNHDAKGCDASILLDSTPNNTAEKAAIPNLSLGVLGFDVIDEVKAQLEKTCPGVVSCADIVALAARDSVSFQFKFPIWEVLTGRRDGLISRASEALSNIPSPFFNFTLLKQSFANKSLTVHDLVVLSGGHTIGVGHCNLFSNRLYNFTGKGDEDPSLNSTYASFLKTQCRSLADNTTTVPMDPLTPLSFDNNYFKILVLNEGLFQSDAALLTDKDSSNIVDELLDPDNFFNEFAQSIMRMGSIGVLTGSAGEIRKNCRVNS
ncbi:hypothetical protein GH714_002485 [Hevea brasiliensis]|uniref:Peroxidase n=1 Tax=Hevea brasiliensis TaxID=3981 RepID=A0A6A6KFP7_HEVBR|nr:hypothetical protein GH714_002485 [Hevea brasiliensis]